MPTDEQAQPNVSVIIPTYNAGPEIKTLLRLLMDQTLKPCEVIVIDSASPDATADMAEKAGARVFSIPQSEFDHGGTRNKAASFAVGDVLVFMTQDAVPADEYLLAELVKPLVSDEVGCAYGRQLPRAGADVLERISREFNYPDEPMMKDKSDLPRLGIKTFFCSNVCSAVRREVFEDLGRFSEPVIFNEDMFFAAGCILAGYSIAYVPEAKVYHSHHYTLTQQFRRFFDNGISMRNNDWIYRYSSVGKEGSKLLRMQLQTLLRLGKWYLIPRLAADNAAKLAGFQLGKQYRRLPAGLCARFSMHRKIWDKLQSGSKGTDKGMTMKG